MDIYILNIILIIFLDIHVYIYDYNIQEVREKKTFGQDHNNQQENIHLYSPMFINMQVLP